MAAFLLTASCSCGGAEGTAGARLEGFITKLSAFPTCFQELWAICAKEVTPGWSGVNQNGKAQQEKVLKCFKLILFLPFPKLGREEWDSHHCLGLSFKIRGCLLSPSPSSKFPLSFQEVGCGHLLHKPSSTMRLWYTPDPCDLCSPYCIYSAIFQSYSWITTSRSISWLSGQCGGIEQVVLETELMMLVFLRILSPNLSLLCPRFLRTPTSSNQSKPGVANIHIHVPTFTRTQIYHWVVSLSPMGSTAQCVLVFPSLCCLYCQKSASCILVVRLLLEKVGHTCLLDSCLLSD